MDIRPTVHTSPSNLSSKSNEAPKMSMLALRGPALFPSPSNMLWEGGRTHEQSFRRQRPSEKIELPSIRQAVPEIGLRAARPDLDRRRGARTCSPRSATISLAWSTDFQHSNKRRRLSVQEENDSDLREFMGSRHCTSPSQSTHRSQSLAVSPTFSGHRANGFSLEESSWTGSTRSSPSMPPRGLPTDASPRPFNTSSITRSNWRPTLPSLPALVPDQSPTIPRRRSNSSWSDGGLPSAPRPVSQPIHIPASAFKPAPSSHQAYSFEQTHGHAGAGAYSSLYERQPGYHGGVFPFSIEAGNELMDSKQRKRRGNLPKETTDMLRTWFVGHLQHPYPTEDEKQELMNQTGLQMNQISNWFINARRRQLPAMINNARAESGARQVRCASAGRLLKNDSASESGDDAGGRDIQAGGTRLRGVSEGHAGSGYEGDFVG